MSDFRLKVIAETQAAENSLKQVDKVATEATRDRNVKIEIPNYSDLSKNFRDLNKDIGSAANGIKDFYKVASKLPVGPINDINELAGQLKRVAVTATDTSRNVGDAGDVIKATFNATNRAAETLVSRLTKIALGLYVIKEAAGLVQGAFGGLFNETIGREIKLRETILKAQTTLASTNKVFRDGKEITDPYQKIVTLTGAVRKNVDSIRERSIALAGVTSGEVIEVFGIVASQVGQIGGGLKEAEDLAINFAAALGTFGIPLYQARQEIGSILRGDITVDSYLATALGIRSQDIAKAKTEAGGVVKFLEERLGAAVAGQRIAAEGFSGVVSNIKDLSELVSQNFGAGLLDPLLDSLTKVFDFLFSIRNEMFAISKLAGESIGTVADTVLKMVGGATGGARQTEMRGEVGTFDPALGNAPALPMQRTVTSDFGADDALKAAKEAVTYVKVEFSKAFSTVYLQISTLLERASSAFLAVGGGLAMLAKGLLSLKIETFKALIGAVESISPALLVAANGLSAFLGLWGKFMELPLVQELAQISAGMKVLEMTGVTPLIMTGGTLVMLFKNWSKVVSFVVTQFNSLRTIIGGVIAYIGALIAQLAGAATSMLTAWAPSLKALEGLRTELIGITQQLNNVAVSAQRAGASLSGAQQKVEGLKGGVIGLIAGFIKFQLIMFAITAAISLVMERFSALKEAQDKIANDKRVQEAIRRLATTYKDLGENATEAQKRAKAFEQSLVNQEYDKAIANLEKVKKKLEELRDLSDERLGNWLQRVLQSMNLANMDVKPQKGESFSDAVYRTRLADQKAAELEVAKYAKEVNKIAALENIELEAQKRVDLSKEYAELQRQQQSDLFQQRQTLAQKEVEIFRAAGELRIFQMEQANAKLIEGEEGASRTALEALNNYLSVRENGELEIEAAKKDIVIEVANLEKTIADYRFENEKKIAEIRRRAGENEKRMADAQRQAAGQGPGDFIGPVPVGASGPLSQLIDGVESYGGNYGAFNRGGSNQGRTAHGRGKDPNIPNMTIAEIQRRQLAPGIPANQQLHAVGKYQIIGATLKGLMDGSYGDTGVKPTDKYSPENQERLFAALARNRIVPGDEAATMRGLRQEWVGLQNVPDAKLRPATRTLMAGGGAGGGAVPAAAASPTPELLSLDVAAPAVEAYTAAVSGLASALERARTLQAAITEARTKAAFEAISKAAFPQVPLENYQDALHEAQLTYTAIAASAGEAFDPERSAIEITRLTAVNASNRELGQILDGIAKRENLTAQQKKSLQEAFTKDHNTYLKGLEKEAILKEQILATQRISDLTSSLNTQTASIYKDIAALQKRNELQFQGVDPAIIEGEEEKLRIQAEVDRQLNSVNDGLAASLTLRDELAKRIGTATDAEKVDLEKQLADAQARIEMLEGLQGTADLTKGAIDAQTAAETEPGAKIRAFIGDARRELNDLQAVAIRVSQGIGDAIGNSIANGITGLIEGTTSAKEVFGNFLKSIGQLLVQEGTKMIATYIAIAIAKSFAGLGGGGLGFGGASDPLGAGGAFWKNANGNAFTGSGVVPFAKGGTFTNSVVSSPTLFKFANGGTTQMGEMGEAGPEAIMPLSRGRGGRLGVDASGLREAMGRPPGGAAGSPVLSLSFQSTTINGVEYVSRDQLEQAMVATRRQAAKEGANRGMSMTLDKLQQSPSTRSRLGIGGR